jgi:hypothetical protein
MRVYQIFGVFCLFLVMLGCSQKPQTSTQQPEQGRPTQTPRVENEPETAPVAAGGSSRRGVMTRKLSDAGNRKEKHPAAGMERPDKWKREAVPSLSQVSQADGKSLIGPEQAEKLRSVSMEQAKVFVTERPVADVLKRYQDEAPKCTVADQDGATLLVIPVQEGTLFVGASSHESKTVVSEFLLPKKPLTTVPDWVRKLEENSEGNP